MDHDETRERLELAALEPGGLDRLMAGDTAAAQAAAAHLAGCPSCSDELARLAAVSNLVRAPVREMPSPELRDRTLAAIRSSGVPRRRWAPPDVSRQPTVALGRSRRPRLGWIATIAAAIALSVVATSLVVGGRSEDQLTTQAETMAVLEDVIHATVAITSRSDVRRVLLVGTTDATLEGSLAFSPSTTQLVVVAKGLTPPPAGQEYRAWVQIGGARTRVGKMIFGQGLAYWVGPAPSISDVSDLATFGVSLVDLARQGVATDPVLIGGL